MIKKFVFFLAAGLLSLCAHAQITFVSASMPMTQSNPPSVSSSFSPQAGDTIIVHNASGGSAYPPTGVTGTGTYTQLGSILNDLNSDALGFWINANAAAGAQTTTLNGVSGHLLWGTVWDYRGVGSVSNPVIKTVSSPGTGVGALAGDPVSVPAGSVLLVLVYDSSSATIGTTITASAPSGTNRVSYTGTSVNDFSWTLQEYAGAGTNITPAFTVSVGTDNYAIAYMVLAPTPVTPPPPSTLATSQALTLVPATIVQNVSNWPISVVGLQVVGNQIENGSGQVVQLRGVDQSGPEYECLGSINVFDSSPGNAPGTANTAALLASWYVNMVRLPLNADCWLNINGVTTGGAPYINQITSYVTQLNARGIAADIDLQWSAPGTQQANASWCNNQFESLPDNDHAPAFWASVANTFKTNSSVVFDLYNEPWPNGNANTAAAWSLLLNGGTDTDCPTTYTAVGTQSLINTIRATGATNIISVPGIQFTDNISQWLTYEPTDPTPAGFGGTWTAQLTADWHSYSDQIYNNLTAWQNGVQPIAAKVPILTSEIGERDNQATYVNSLLNWADSIGNISYLAWAWDSYGSGFPSLITDGNGDPTGFGYGIQNHYTLLATGAGVQQTPLPKFQTTYPFGIWFGTSQYTASDTTVYYPDVASSSLAVNVGSYAQYTTTDTITGTSDPILFKTGRQGVTGNWVINVPNGPYNVTLYYAKPSNSFTAICSTTTANPTPPCFDPWGEDVTIMGNVVASCAFTYYSGTNVFPAPSPANIACPQAAQTAPSLDVATSVTYSGVTVTNQQLSIQVAASFGGGRTSLLNAIKIAQAP